MEDDNSSKLHNPWSSLPTVTTFDKGPSSCSTRCVGESEKSKECKKIMKKVKTSSSILISTLISHLCTVLEKDQVQSKRLCFLLCDTLHKMKLIDPSYKMEGFELLHDKYMNAMYHLISIARSTIGSDNTIPIPKPLVTYISPYQDQFQEIGFIAGGGFGNVYKAVHKLDEVEYAIKKIIVRPGRVKTIMNHLEEVKTLAKLNHTNIVSYKQAWIEPMAAPSIPQLPCTSKTESNITCNSEINYNLKNSFIECENYSHMIHRSKKSFKYLSKSQNLNYFNKAIDRNVSCESSSDVVSFREDNDVCDISIESDESNIIEISSRTSTEESSSDESLENCRISQYSSQINQFAILYIQMALCEKTLRQWLDERTESTPISLVAGITTQILCGLNYIHSLKIVHHDIKPSNIFISTSGKLQIQLGDFGLACPLQRDSHNVIVGTCMYAAPEQLKGQCDPKSDIYSLGIVLLELLIHMQTSMECIKLIESLKKGKISDMSVTLHPKWANIISQLVQENPARRPSADKLLEDLKIDKDLTISKLQYENERLQSENNLLQNKNREKDKIIEHQKIKIEELLLKLAKLENKC